PARRPVVLRRVLRDLAAARMSPLATRIAMSQTMASPMAAPPLVPATTPSETAQIADLVRLASFEATRPSAAEIDALAAAAVRGAPVYVSAVAARPLNEQVVVARRLAA